MSNQRGELLAKISKAATLSEQARLIEQLDNYDAATRRKTAQAREVDLGNAIVRDTLTPVRVHEMHTASTDWIADFEAPSDKTAHQASIAAAAYWFSKTSAEVKADPEEFGIQAEGFMRREASQHGEQAAAVKRAGLDYIAFLYRQAASGLDQVQQTVDPHDNPKTTPLDPTVFDNFADEVDPINQGVVGTETSERAPLLQQIEQEGAGIGQPEKPGGHSTGDEVSNPDENLDASSGPLGGWGNSTVAINHSMTLDDFRRQAASGLDEVQQVVNPHEDPAPTPLPTQVAFPWEISPDAYGNGGEEDDERKEAARHPFGREGGFEGHSWEPEEDPELSEHGPSDHELPYPASGWSHFQSQHPGLVNDKADFSDHQLGGGSGNDHTYVEPGPRGGDAGHLQTSHPLFSNDKGDFSGHEYHATRKQADMFGNSDNPHAVPGPSPANSPATTPTPNAGFAEGQADGLAGNHPQFSDASSAAPANVQQYAQGYSSGVQQRQQGRTQDVPVSLGGDNGQSLASRVSDRFVKAASRKDVDFTKGYGFATKWAPGKPLVTLGSAQFEAGIFAGLADNPKHREAWDNAHRRQARKDQRFATRASAHARYVAHLASTGISLEAATTTDLDTMDPSASPSPTGQTPINGPGTVPPLAGQADPAAPGGPAPYNGAEPFGSPVVPTGPAPATPGSNLVNDIVGGPVDKAFTTNPQTLAFRRQVQARLLAQNTKG